MDEWAIVILCGEWAVVIMCGVCATLGAFMAALLARNEPDAPSWWCPPLGVALAIWAGLTMGVLTG